MLIRCLYLFCSLHFQVFCTPLIIYTVYIKSLECSSAPNLFYTDNINFNQQKINFGTWASTAMSLKSVNKKQDGGSVLETEGLWKGPQNVCLESEYVQVPHFPELVWYNENHQNALHLDPFEQTREKLVRRKCIDQEELILQIHQSVQCNGPTVPGPGIKLFQKAHPDWIAQKERWESSSSTSSLGMSAALAKSETDPGGGDWRGSLLTCYLWPPKELKLSTP